MITGFCSSKRNGDSGAATSTAQVDGSSRARPPKPAPFASSARSWSHRQAGRGSAGTCGATIEGRFTTTWVDRDAIPYERMWEDDRLWIPHMLAEQPFTARTVFDGDRLLEWELDVHDDDHTWDGSS